MRVMAITNSANRQLLKVAKGIAPSLFGAGTEQGFHFVAVHLVVVLIIFLCCALAVGGGVGGGGLYMPLLVATTGDAHSAVPLAKVATNGVAVAGTVFNLWRTHPAGGPLINYDVALLLEPLTLVGTVGGVIMNVLLPSEVLLLLLIAVLTLSSYVSIQKGWERKALEDAEIAEKASENASKKPLLDEDSMGVKSADEGAGIKGDSQTTTRMPTPRGRLTNRSNKIEPTLREASLMSVKSVDSTMSENYKSPLAGVKLYFLPITLVAMGVVVHMCTMFYSGGATGLLCGDGMTSKRVFIMCDFIFLTALVLIWRWKVLAWNADTGNARDALYTSKSTVVAPILSGLAGVGAGGLGIAGGLMKGPIMLAWGLRPDEATTTSLFMIMFTSSSTIMQYALMGRLHFGPAAIIWVAGALGGIVGSHVVVKLLEKTNRQSYVSLGLGFIIIGSMIAMASVTIYDLAMGKGKPAQSLSDFCAHEGKGVQQHMLHLYQTHSELLEVPDY